LYKKSGRRLRVVVLLPDPDGPEAGRGDENFEYLNAEASDLAVLEAAREAGFDAALVQVHLGNLDETVAALECDAVINLCDGTGAGKDGIPGLEAIEALERRGLPYTGARAAAYSIGSDKAAMKERFLAAGVPTARFQLMQTADDPLNAELSFPLIVKPRDAGGSAGIRLSSVVMDEAALREQVACTAATYGEALVAEYIDGRELTVGVLGSGSDVKVFPPLEICFGEAFPPERRVRTFESKWDVTSPLYGAMELLCPAPLPPVETRRIGRVARAAYQAIEGSGYGRVDLRLDERGPWVIEVNPNCCLEWNEAELADCAMFPIAARAAGLSYPELIRRLVLQALGRRTALRGLKALAA
jgi:D-alanine-D-alanine ligase